MSKAKFEAKGKDDAEKVLKLQQTKALNMSAYVVGLEEVKTTSDKVEEIQQNPSKSTAKELYDAKINKILAQTKLESFKKSYLEDFGEELKF